MYTYLIINLASVAVPLLASFDRRLRFDRWFGSFLPAVSITAAFFIGWDILFTHLGVWGFNPRYLTGVQISNLPLEEVMFFFLIPFASIFTYHAIKYFFPVSPVNRYSYIISWVLFVILLIAGIMSIPRLYTSITFLLTAIFILLTGIIRKEDFLGHFYFAYIFILIPFLLVNGLLTGTGIPEEVVWYDDTQNLGLRILTIPIEDSVYGFLMLAMTAFFMEQFQAKRNSRKVVS